MAKVDSAWLAKAPPLVKVLPAKLPKPGNLAGNRGGDKFVGIGQPLSRMLWVAYDWPPNRILFTMGSRKSGMILSRRCRKVRGRLCNKR